jgi:hypothetical protein
MATGHHCQAAPSFTVAVKWAAYADDRCTQLRVQFTHDFLLGDLDRFEVEGFRQPDQGGE